MAWPEVVFVGKYIGIVGRLAHLADFAPHDLRVVTYEPDDAPATLPPTTVAIVVDQHDLQERYRGLPMLFHDRLASHHRHLGKWSVSISGMGMDTSDDSLESGSSHVSDDNEARQFCLLFFLAAIEHALKSEQRTLTSDERLRIVAFDREMSSYLEPYDPTDDGVAVVRLSLESMRLELGTPVLDREILRRCLDRIREQVARFDIFADVGELGDELTDLIRTMQTPGR